MQNRVMEHVDKLKTYVEVREKVVAFCQTAGASEDNNFNQLECTRPEDEWPEEEEWPAEADVQGFSDMK